MKRLCLLTALLLLCAGCAAGPAAPNAGPPAQTGPSAAPDTLAGSLPASNSQTTTQAGDIVLYNGDQIVIFYGSNSWSYTRIGHIEDLTGWAEALGGGDLAVSFSLAGQE